MEVIAKTTKCIVFGPPIFSRGITPIFMTLLALYASYRLTKFEFRLLTPDLHVQSLTMRQKLEFTQGGYK